MIVFLVINIVFMILLSYYSDSVPELFLISLILLAYKTKINKNHLKLYALLSGYFCDVFYFSEYPVHTLTYFVVFLIVYYKIKNFIILNYVNFLEILFLALLLERLIFLFLNLTLNLNIKIISGFYSFLFEVISVVFFSYFYYRIFLRTEKKVF